MKIERGDRALTLRPDMRASITSLTRRGRGVLRPAPKDLGSPLAASSFPLAPYANRIDGGPFAFQDRAVRLPAMLGFEPHALRGVGWRSRWSVLLAQPRRQGLADAQASISLWDHSPTGIVSPRELTCRTVSPPDGDPRFRCLS